MGSPPPQLYTYSTIHGLVAIRLLVKRAQVIYSGAVAILAQGISKHLLSGIDHHHHHHHYHHHQHHYRHHHHHHHRVVPNDMLIRCSDESLTLSTIVSQLQIHPKTAQKSSKIFPMRCKNIQKKFQKPIREGKASQKHL